MPGKRWSQLSPDTQARYRREGVSPATYNSWHQKSGTQRSILGAKARRQGFGSGWDRAVKESAPKQRAKLVTDIAREKLRGNGRARYWTDPKSAARIASRDANEKLLPVGQMQTVARITSTAADRDWTGSQLYHELRDGGIDHATAAAIAYS